MQIRSHQVTSLTQGLQQPPIMVWLTPSLSDGQWTVPHTLPSSARVFPCWCSGLPDTPLQGHPFSSQWPSTQRNHTKLSDLRLYVISHYSWVKKTNIPTGPQHPHASPGKSSCKPSTSLVKFLVFVYTVRRWIICWVSCTLGHFFFQVLQTVQHFTIE